MRFTLKQTVESYESSLIQEALRQHAFSAKDAAQALGVEYQTFYMKMRKYGLTRKQQRVSRDTRQTRSVGIDAVGTSLVD
jgi:DNA-binding NtrC family response regulator